MERLLRVQLDGVLLITPKYDGFLTERILKIFTANFDSLDTLLRS